MRNPANVFRWPFTLVMLLLLALVGIMLEKPAGSIEGRLALQQEGFNLFSYDLRGHHVYAMAIGPRGDQSQERGVWVNRDGTFRIDQLPVGEYEVKVHVPGFATSYDSGIFVENNEVTTLSHDIALQLSNPSVRVGSRTRVFTTKEQPHFWLNAEGSSQAEVRVYSREMLPLIRSLYDPKKSATAQEKYGFEISTDLSVYKPYDDISKKKAEKFFGDMKPIREWKRELATDESDYSHQEFKFEKPLPPGDYFAVAKVSNVQNKSDWNVMWFTVTDVGLIVKQDPWQTLVRAIDLNTLKPVPNYSLNLINRDTPDHAFASAKTGADGFAKIPMKDTINDSTTLIVYGTQGDQHSYGAYGFYNGQSEAMQTYFYTDRPVYRLGQTVYYKGIARKKSLNGFVNPGGNMKVKATVEDPDNNAFHNDNLKTNAHGSFHGLVEIPKEGKTGAYQITFTYPDGSQDYERFEVAEYRKPEYQVTVTPMDSRVVAGQKVRARVKAAYYFGAPVTNAKVKYTIYSSIDWSGRYELMDRPAYYDYFDGWDHEDEGYSESGYGGDYVTEGVATTDENGEAIVEFDTKRSTFDAARPWEYDRYDRNYKIEAEVTDISRLAVIGSGVERVTGGEYCVFVNPDSYVAKVGEPISADVTAVSYKDSQPVRNARINMQLYRRPYDSVKGQYRPAEVYENTWVTTDDKGHAKVVMNTKPQFVTDDYHLLAVAEDQFHNRIVDESYIWVVSESYPYALNEREAAKEPLTVKLDKEVYKAGDTAKVMITAPVTGMEGAQAIVSVEGAKLYNYRVVDMKATGQMVEIPLTVDYAPNVFVNVTFVGKKHQFYSSSQMVRVSPDDRFLHITVETDKSRYKPGENATYTVTAKYADGKPAANTELSLGVVDESIYAIRPDATQDIRKFFYSRTSNMVTTICSFPEEYSGGPNKIEPRVRKDFRDTAAWQPQLVTDANGVAKATIMLPDNLTTWRATVRAISMTCDVGSAVQKVISTQDLILRLALPRFFTQGDEGFITAVVHNYTDKMQPVQLTLSPSPEFQMNDSLVQTVNVEPDKAMRVNWRTKLVSAGDAVVRCKAVGATAGDAMETKLPVLPLGVEMFASKSGIITAEEDTANVSSLVPPDAVPGSVKQHIYLSSSALGPILGNFHSLIDYPYGCTEQTMSKLMPSVVAMRMNQTLGLPLSKEEKKKFGEVYKQSMQKLDGYQHEDGGWGWWANDESNMNLTALVLDGYKLLKDAGYKVEKEREDNGKNWLVTNCATLHKQLTDPMTKQPSEWQIREHSIDMAKAYNVLSQYGVKTPANIKKWALDRRNKSTPEVLAFYAMAFQRQGDVEAARAMYDRLVELGNVTTGDAGTLLDWAPSARMMKLIDPSVDTKNHYYSYRYTDIETTALALEATLMVDPQNSDRIENVKRWILMQRGIDGWSNTKTTSEVFRAFMASELNQRAAGMTTDFTADITVGSGPRRDETSAASLIRPIAFGSASVLEQEKDILVKSKPGSESKIAIHKKGAGKLYYTVLTTYYKAIKPGDFVAQKGMPDGLKLRREFFRLTPSKPDSEGRVKFTAQALPDKKIRAGETLLMKVYVEAPTELPYTFLKAPLPSGAEVVENDSRADEASSDEANSNPNDEGYSWGNWWWTHQDVMDDHLAFFVTDMNRGRLEFHQMVRMEIPGKFQMNPVYLEGMYTKAVRAHSGADTITVTE